MLSAICTIDSTICPLIKCIIKFILVKDIPSLTWDSNVVLLHNLLRVNKGEYSLLREYSPNYFSNNQ